MFGCKRHFTTPIFCSPNSPCRAIAESLPESELCVTEYRKTAAHDRPVHAHLPFAEHWGEGTTSSSDGQRFRAGGHRESAGNRNAKRGSEPGVLFYTHLSDQYAPLYTKVINANVRDATHVLDGLPTGYM